MNSGKLDSRRDWNVWERKSKMKWRKSKRLQVQHLNLFLLRSPTFSNRIIRGKRNIIKPLVSVVSNAKNTRQGNSMAGDSVWPASKILTLLSNMRIKHGRKFHEIEISTAQNCYNFDFSPFMVKKIRAMSSVITYCWDRQLFLFQKRGIVPRLPFLPVE